MFVLEYNHMYKVLIEVDNHMLNMDQVNDKKVLIEYYNLYFDYNNQNMLKLVHIKHMTNMLMEDINMFARMYHI
jgi:hypothetical protein